MEQTAAFTKENSDLPWEVHGQLSQGSQSPASASGHAVGQQNDSDKLCEVIKSMLLAQRKQLVSHIDRVMAEQKEMLEHHLRHQISCSVEHASRTHAPHRPATEFTSDPTGSMTSNYSGPPPPAIKAASKPTDSMTSLNYSGPPPPAIEAASDPTGSMASNYSGPPPPAVKAASKPTDSMTSSNYSGLPPPATEVNHDFSMNSSPNRQTDENARGNSTMIAKCESNLSRTRSDGVKGVQTKKIPDAWIPNRSKDKKTSTLSNRYEQEGKTGIKYCRAVMQSAIGSSEFEIIVFATILTNVILLGVEVQYVASKGAETSPTAFFILDAAFTAFFALEVAARTVAEGWSYWDPRKELWWNMFDLLIVILSFLDMLVGLASEAGVSKAFRLLRVFRLLRTLRLVRLVRFIHSLRSLINSIASTLKSLSWAMILLFGIIYGFALAFTHLVTDHYVTMDKDVPVVNHDTTLANFWGTMFRSMLTLFKSITNGISWHEIITPLAIIGWFPVALFFGYIIFSFFAVLNVITAVFCQAAIDCAFQDRESMTMQMLAQKKEYVEIVNRLFEEIDADSSGNITLEEFEDFLTRADCEAYFHSLGIEPDNARLVFKLLDTDGSDSIDCEEFAFGCMNFKGGAKAIHMARLEREQKSFRSMVEQFIKITDLQLAALGSWAGLPPIHRLGDNTPMKKRGGGRPS